LAASAFRPESFIDPSVLLASKYPLGTAVLNLDAEDFRALFSAGHSWLEQHHQSVNALNVFPVPDGDTGTNMLLTMQSALEEIQTARSNHAGDVVQAAAHGALMGARGNSGVILSQILRGIAHGLSGEDLVDAAELSDAFLKGSETAYRGVVRPVEGTVLTVIREVAEALQKADRLRDLRAVLDLAVRTAAQSVEKTPRLLAVLAEAGVVDAGGQGLYLVLEGMSRCLRGLSVTAEERALPDAVLHPAVLESEYGYDVQCVILGNELDVDRMREVIMGMGDSVLVVGDSRAVKVHVHTDAPGNPLNYCAQQGRIDRVIVENMQLQYERFISSGEPSDRMSGGDKQPAAPSPASLVSSPVASGPIGTIAVASGEGIAQVFRSLGAHATVSGGQTMNPSTQCILEAIEALPVQDAIVLPNNKNIILAAQQAQTLSTKNVRVVGSTSVPQGISALLVVNQQADLDANVEAMQSALQSVQTGEVTVAVRDVHLGDLLVSEGDFIGLKDDELATKGSDPASVAVSLLEMMHAQDAEIITLYRGEPLAMDEAESLLGRLRDLYPGQEIELVDGGQSHYHYIISVE
jgi:DAK2 domain fusion protein YloV